jgi:15-cis-phytoene synthase
MQAHPWEPSLLQLAYEAVNTVVPVRDDVAYEEEALNRAYEHVEYVTSVHSRSFHMASALLPREKRRAARALYAFCRRVDDIIDEAGDGAPLDAARELQAWRQQSLLANPPADDPIALAWADTRMKYGIPYRYAEQLMDGVARDLRQNRYETFEDLTTYSYGVASTVGLMSMHIIGYASDDAIPYAIKLGVALQTTNILRDVGEDWCMGRLYLPLEDLEHFGVTESDIASGEVTDRWRDFMRFQIARNRQLYQEARPGISMLKDDGHFAITAAADLYAAILDDIEAADYDVLGRRAYVSTARKIGMLPGIWWRSRTK